MAAINPSKRGVTCFGKQLVTQFLTRSSNSTRSIYAFSPAFRRSMHGSVYDKNIEDHVRPVVVPDDVIQTNSDKYWGPNPSTGVFGPDAEQYPSGSVNRGLYASQSNVGNESVLEQQAFFRPVEDLDKPQHP